MTQPDVKPTKKKENKMKSIYYTIENETGQTWDHESREWVNPEVAEPERVRYTDLDKAKTENVNPRNGAYITKWGESEYGVFPLKVIERNKIKLEGYEVEFVGTGKEIAAYVNGADIASVTGTADDVIRNYLEEARNSCGEDALYEAVSAATAQERIEE